MLHGRERPRQRVAARLKVTPHFHFDRESSSHSTLLQVVAPDTPGLLRAVAAVIAGCGCNIEVALIDTEGEIAIDVFYLTAGHEKLAAREEQCVAEGIEAMFVAKGMAVRPQVQTPEPLPMKAGKDAPAEIA